MVEPQPIKAIKQATSPQSAYGYQGSPQALGDNPDSAVNTQGYIVPSLIELASYQSTSWLRWVLINVLSFMTALFTFCFFVFVTIRLLDTQSHETVSWITNLIIQQRAIMAHLIVGLYAGLTAAVVALVQRAAFHYKVRRWPWVAKTALAVGILVPASSFVARLGTSRLVANESWRSYALSALIVFGITSIGTALIQATEIKRVVKNPNQWIWLSSLTWTISGSLGLSSLVSLLIQIITKLS